MDDLVASICLGIHQDFEDGFSMFTLPKFNSLPLEKLPKPNRKVYSLPSIIFQERNVKLEGVIYMLILVNLGSIYHSKGCLCQKKTGPALCGSKSARNWEPWDPGARTKTNGWVSFQGGSGKADTNGLKYAPPEMAEHKWVSRDVTLRP